MYVFTRKDGRVIQIDQLYGYPSKTNIIPHLMEKVYSTFPQGYHIAWDHAAMYNPYGDYSYETWAVYELVEPHICKDGKCSHSIVYSEEQEMDDAESGSEESQCKTYSVWLSRYNQELLDEVTQNELPHFISEMVAFYYALQTVMVDDESCCQFPEWL